MAWGAGGGWRGKGVVGGCLLTSGFAAAQSPNLIFLRSLSGMRFAQEKANLRAITLRW